MGKVSMGYDPYATENDPSKIPHISVQPLSQTLGCGQPCSAFGVSSAGACAGAIAVTCINGIVVCSDCSATSSSCVVTTGADCKRECEGELVCPDPSSCFERVCCPNSRWCEQNTMVLCDETGRETRRYPCAPGLDCYENGCRPARPNVLVLFDSSGSMSGIVDGADLSSTSQWPACDDPEAPVRRLGKSKKAFSELFGSSAFSHVYFSLLRFPQRVDGVGSSVCPDGAYTAQNTVTGHLENGVKYAIPDNNNGAWFERNLSEILLVGFPKQPQESNRSQLISWLDFQELTSETDVECTHHSDCGAGMCSQPGGSGTCRIYENPELRAVGWTPLGTSLFYAGEYFRKYVVADGKSCILQADCESAGYFCIDGLCQDPNRRCRQRSIVVFTDGIDTSSPGLFMQPVVQAKRMRMGLDCNLSADCASGYVCGVSGTCQFQEGPHNPCQSVNGSCELEATLFPDAFKEGHNRLRDRLSQPIRITTHIVNAAGTQNASISEIAAYGGGQVIDVDLADPASLLNGIQGAVGWKDVKLTCVEE